MISVETRKEYDLKKKFFFLTEIVIGSPGAR